jgi:hypothetical protein
MASTGALTAIGDPVSRALGVPSPGTLGGAKPISH